MMYVMLLRCLLLRAWFNKIAPKKKKKKMMTMKIAMLMMIIAFHR